MPEWLITTNEEDTPEQQLKHARQIAARAKGGLFRPVAYINNAKGEPITGTMMMQELADQMQAKQSPPRPLVPLAPPTSA